MAKTTIVHITDDLDGSKDAKTVAFSYEGIEYTIDLGKKNSAAFEKALKPYLDAATKVSKRGVSRGASKASGPDLATVRAWAKENGIEVSDRGRVAKTVLDRFSDAQK